MKLRSHQLDSLVAMQQCDKGQIIVPTGGGKTMCMIEDAKYRFGMDSVCIKDYRCCCSSYLTCKSVISRFS